MLLKNQNTLYAIRILGSGSLNYRLVFVVVGFLVILFAVCFFLTKVYGARELRRRAVELPQKRSQLSRRCSEKKAS